MYKHKEVVLRTYDTKQLWQNCSTTSYSSKNVVEQTISDDCDECRGNAPLDNIITAESGDVTWQKRGHSSFNRVMTVISTDSRKILDIEAMSKTCKTCKLHQYFKKLIQ